MTASNAPDMDQRIQRALGELGAEHDPPSGWEARVLAAIAEQRIGDQLAQLGEDLVPPPGWEDRVLAATRASSRRRAWWLAMPAVAAAAAVLLLWIVPRSGQPLVRPTVVASGAPPAGAPPERRLRGKDIVHGDTMTVVARSRAAYRALWIYQSDRLVLRCPAPEDHRNTPQCQDDDDALVGTVPDAKIGRYIAIAVASNTPIREPQGNRDQDVAALDASAKVERTEIPVW